MAKKSFSFLAIVCALIFVSSSLRGQVNDSPEATQGKTNAFSEVEFLIDLVQIIEIDKDRLQQMKRDSVALEPRFQARSLRFFELDGLLDSARENSTVTLNENLVKYEWHHLKKVLEFLLHRRRALALQIQILSHKIKKEEEALAFMIKGETFSIIEFDLISRKTLEAAAKRTEAEHDSTGVDTSESHNWSVVEEKQELAKLTAHFDFRKREWDIVQSILSLNQDELNSASILSGLSSEQESFWRQRLKTMDDQLKDSTQSGNSKFYSLTEKLRDETISTIIPTVNKMEVQDSVLISGLQWRITSLQDKQDGLAKSIADLTTSIENKDRWINFLKSPLAPRRIYSFIVNQGPRILAIILLLILSWFVLKGIINIVLSNLKFRQYKPAERLERIDTLKHAFRSGLAVFFMMTGTIIILSEVGVDISVVLGGAAIISVAFAFGAQTLIKDYFSGFMVLTENQYRIGNVIRINNVEGVVEDVSLRITTLRDLDGVAHFIPHSEIKIVSNYSHGWSQVNLNIRISYAQSVDTLIGVINDVSKELKAEEEYGSLIIAEPEMLGVEAFEDSGLIIKILIKTLPAKQWTIKREFLKRLKNRFDELGIEMAVPIRKLIYASSEARLREEEAD